MSITTISSIIYRTVIIIMVNSNLNDDGFVKTNWASFKIIGIVFRSLYLLTFIYISFMWLKLVTEFIQTKKENLKMHQLSLNKFNKFMIFTIYAISIVAILHTLWTGSMGIYEFIYRKDIQND